MNRREFIAQTGLSALAAGVGFSTPSITKAINAPTQTPVIKRTSTSEITDTTKKPVTTHLGDNWVDIQFAPTSRSIIEEFEFFCDMKCFMNDQTRSPNVTTYLKLGFYTHPTLAERDSRFIGIHPIDGDINFVSFYDPTKLQKDGRWTVSSIISSGDPAITSAGQSPLIKVHARRTARGYDLELTWDTIEEIPPETFVGPNAAKHVKRGAKFHMPIPPLYGFVTSVIDSRNFVGSLSSPSLFPFNTTMQQVNNVSGTFVLTQMKTDVNPDFARTRCTIDQSGAIYDATQSAWDDSQGNIDMHVMWVEPNAHQAAVVDDVNVKRLYVGEPYERYVIVDNDARDNPKFIPGVIDPEDTRPISLKHQSHTRSQPFAVYATLGEFYATQDFHNTVALVRSTREVTWVAPTINALSRIDDILTAVDATEGIRDQFPKVSQGTDEGHFTPVELVTGLADITKLTMQVYQDYTIRDGDSTITNVSATLYVLGDDILSGRVVLPPEFDIEKPIKCIVDNHRERVLHFVREPYPIIRPPVPVICEEPPDIVR